MTSYSNHDDVGPTIQQSEDGLLLREFAHRTGNEIAAATAAMRLASGVRRGSSRDRLMLEGIDRLERFGELHRLLAHPPRGRVDAGAQLDRLCRAVAAGRHDASGSAVLLDLPRIEVDAPVARRIVLVAAELVSNAVRHALSGRTGELRVTLRLEGGDLVLHVGDDGPGVRATARTSGTGLGRDIVSELVANGGGSISTDSGAGGTTVTVTIPIVDDHVPF